MDPIVHNLRARAADLRRLATDLDREKLAAMTTTLPLDAVIETAPDILAGKVRGRIVVEVGG